MSEFIRNVWTRAMLRGSHYRDRHALLDQLYWIKDPWHMDTEAENFRFEETNRLIQMHLSPIDTLLEIGCGEGHQTVRLADLCSKLYAIDISGRAVKRAKQRCPRAIFSVGDVFTAPILRLVPRFDVVVACEVLYYMSDIPAVLARMEQLGRSCFVTTYVSEQHVQLASLLERVPRRQEAEFAHNHTRWRAVWWRVEPDM